MRRLISAAVLAATLGVRPVAAHAFLQAAIPAVGSTVQQAPGEVVITFTEGVEPLFSTIAVQDSAGADVETGPVHLAGDRSHLAVALKPLAPGRFTVIWHVTSTDTHKTEGRFSFTVGK